MNPPCSPRPAGPRGTARLAMLALAWLVAVSVRADAIFLRGGEKLVGKVIAEHAEKVVFESRTLGRFEISRDRIERIEREISAPELDSTNRTSKALPSGLGPGGLFLPWTTDPADGMGFDWVQLKSGEWLKGRVKSLQEEKLEFDSEELDLFTFDWKDIHALHSPRLNSVRIEKLKPVDGHVFVTTNEVQIVTSTETNVYPRTDLIAITPTGNRELDKWTGKISAGVSFRSGNTRETDINAQFALQRRTPETRLGLDYLGNFGEVKDVGTTEENHRVTGQFDYFLSRRFYARVPDVEYLRDPLQNREHQITLGAGVGYDLVKTPRTEWNITVSPSWQRTWFGSVPATNSATVDSVALVLETKFDTELTRRLDLIFNYRGQLTRKESGNDLQHVETTLEFEIHKRLKLDISFVWDRISDPKPEAGGKTPSPDDFKLITALGVDF